MGLLLLLALLVPLQEVGLWEALAWAALWSVGVCLAALYLEALSTT
jgi:hypothetical protein